MQEIAKLFMNGTSQAVRLPEDVCFPGEEVFIRRDTATGEVILSPKLSGWDEFVQTRDALIAQAPEEFDNFLSQRATVLEVDRDPFR